MSKLVLDTNALYAVIGLSPNFKVNKAKLAKHELYTTTPALIEGIVKFSTDMSDIKTLLRPVIKEEIKLISMGFVPLSNDMIRSLYYSPSIKCVTPNIDKILDLKVQKEAEFLRWILFICISGLINILSEALEYKFTDKNKEHQFQKLNKALLEANKEHILKELQQSLRKGYAQKESQQFVLQAFNGFLSSHIYVVKLNY